MKKNFKKLKLKILFHFKTKSIKRKYNLIKENFLSFLKNKNIWKNKNI